MAQTKARWSSRLISRAATQVIAVAGILLIAPSCTFHTNQVVATETVEALMSERTQVTERRPHHVELRGNVRSDEVNAQVAFVDECRGHFDTPVVKVTRKTRTIDHPGLSSAIAILGAGAVAGLPYWYFSGCGGEDNQSSCRPGDADDAEGWRMAGLVGAAAILEGHATWMALAGRDSKEVQFLERVKNDGEWEHCPAPVPENASLEVLVRFESGRERLIQRVALGETGNVSVQLPDIRNDFAAYGAGTVVLRHATTEQELGCGDWAMCTSGTACSRLRQTQTKDSQSIQGAFRGWLTSERDASSNHFIEIWTGVAKLMAELQAGESQCTESERVQMRKQWTELLAKMSLDVAVVVDRDAALRLTAEIGEVRGMAGGSSPYEVALAGWLKQLQAEATNVDRRLAAWCGRQAQALQRDAGESGSDYDTLVVAIMRLKKQCAGSKGEGAVLQSVTKIWTAACRQDGESRCSDACEAGVRFGCDRVQQFEAARQRQALEAERQEEREEAARQAAEAKRDAAYKRWRTSVRNYCLRNPTRWCACYKVRLYDIDTEDTISHMLGLPGDPCPSACRYEAGAAPECR
jgi:hypothetical protein